MELTLCLIYYLLLINVIIIFYNYYFNYLYVYKWNNAKLNNKNKLINTFNVNGCVIIKNMLSTYDCDMLLNIINFQESQQNNKYGDIMSSYNRKDLILPLYYTNYYINKICNKLKVFCNDLVPNYKIVESSCLISYPGCYPQIWHKDTYYKNKNKNKDGNLISFGIALDDINKEMGPLEVYLKSNSIYEQDNGFLYSKYNIKLRQLDGEIDNGIRYQSDEALCNALKFKKKQCISNKGDLVIWSSKVYHRGGKNVLKKRPVFYFSLLGSGNAPNGATYSLLTKDK